MLRVILTGLAGAGKTEVCREIAEAGPPLSQGHSRSHDVDAETWLNRTMICGPTGTACNNLSDLGAETLDRCTAVYNTEFSDQQLKALCLVWRGKTRLLIDEFSMVGRVKLAKASHNLNKIFYKLAADEADDPLELTCDDMFPYGFGGLDVFLVGDLGQAPPVQDTSLADVSRCTAASNLSWNWSNKGAELFRQFLDPHEGIECLVVRLRRIYRNPNLSPAEIHFKDACVRLRDAAITSQDYKLFQSLADPARVKALSANGAVTLVGDNQKCGELNGMKIAQCCPWVHIFEAYFNEDQAKRQKHRIKEFDAFASFLHLGIGAKVMLTANAIVDVPVVS